MYRRKKGTEVSYTPKETGRYFSMAARYSKARNIWPSRAFKVGDTNIFYYPSMRSPTFEWKVTLTGYPSEGGSPGGGEVPTDPNPTPPPPGDGRRVSHIAVYYQTVTFGWCWLQGTSSSGVQVPLNAVTTSTRLVLAPYSSGTQWPSDMSDFDAVIYLPGSSSYDPLEPDFFESFSSFPGCEDFYLYSYGAYYLITGGCTIPQEPILSLGCNGEAGSSQSWTFVVTYEDGSTSGGSGGGDPGGGDDTTGYTYDCNCPDFSRKQGPIGHSPWPSEKEQRDWTFSNAGITQIPGGKCKHIINAELLFKKKLPGAENYNFADSPPESPNESPEWFWEWLKQKRPYLSDQPSDSPVFNEPFDPLAEAEDVPYSFAFDEWLAAGNFGDEPFGRLDVGLPFIYRAPNFVHRPTPDTYQKYALVPYYVPASDANVFSELSSVTRLYFENFENFHNSIIEGGSGFSGSRIQG